MTSPLDLGKAARTAYYRAIDGRVVDGEWDSLSDDERTAWVAVGTSVFS